MRDILNHITFDPLLDSGWLIMLALALFIAALSAGVAQLKSYFARLVAGLFLMLALLNPQALEQDRQAVPDTLLVISDKTESMQIEGRQALSQAIEQEISEKLGLAENLDIITVDIPPDDKGSLLQKALIDGLAGIPKSRLAGIIALTDGRAHDITEQSTQIIPPEIPFHAIIIGNIDARDRRISAIKAPQYGVVGEKAEFELRVDDPGHEGERARIIVQLNGELKARFPITIGQSVSIPLEIERRGSNTVEMRVEGIEGELTLNNNLFVSEILGIRDRLRVLLITGEPHSGGRAWRNLLKSDPALDLVQFTILTVPGIKLRRANPNELSLIQFPTRQLFEQKLDEFDLIIFDQYERRSFPTQGGRRQPNILPQYYQNIVRYVENGGALLLATGPAFAGDGSLFRTPLAAILPTRPNGEIIEDIYRPLLNDKGEKHPITASFTGNLAQNWGHWYRIIDNDPISGHVLMEGPDGVPLFIIDKTRKGRVAMLMSDQAWLWAKGHDGGGPYREMFRRTAHWLMNEPELDAETLKARNIDGALEIERRSLDAVNGPVTIIYPDGTLTQTELDQSSNGTYRARIALKGNGAYQLRQGGLSTITAIGALNPREYAQLLPDLETLAPLAENSGGTITAIGLEAEAIPDIRQLKPGRNMAGNGWIGIAAHDNYTITQSRRTPLILPIIYFLAFFIFLLWAWRREGR